VFGGIGGMPAKAPEACKQGGARNPNREEGRAGPCGVETGTGVESRFGDSEGVSLAAW